MRAACVHMEDSKSEAEAEAQKEVEAEDDVAIGSGEEAEAEVDAPRDEAGEAGAQEVRRSMRTRMRRGRRRAADVTRGADATGR